MQMGKKHVTREDFCFS